VTIGGKNATGAGGDQQTHLIKEYLLKHNNLAVIYLNKSPTTDSIQSERVFSIKGRQLYLPRAFRYVDVIISHGGTGTIGCSLQSGVPSVILPTNCGDQVQNGRMIQDRDPGILSASEKRLVTTIILYGSYCTDHLYGLYGTGRIILYR
jgi:UDP:flavonoid glycosyltransferase YjiC (YdhE family)